MASISTIPAVVDLGIPGVAAYVWDVVENRIEWSEGLLCLYGITEPPAGDIGFAALVHPEDRVRVEAETSAFLVSGDRYVHEFRILRPDGSVRRVHDRGAIERGPDGRALRIRGVNVDVTSSQPTISPVISAPSPPRARPAAFARNEKRLRLAQEAGGVASWEYDVGSGEVVWSASARHLFQVEPGWQPSYAGFLDLVHPDDRERVRAAIEEAVVRDGPLDHVFRIVTPSGVRWLESRARMVRDDASGRTCLVGVDIDVTALVETEHALRAREAELETVQTVAGLAEFEVDLLRDHEGTYSAAYRAMHGLAPDIVEHRPDWLRRVHPGDRERVASALDAALAATDDVLENEYRIVLPDGEVRWLQSRARIERDEGGRARRLVGAQRNVTAEHARAEAQRAAEERLRAILDTMPPAVWSARPDGTRDYFNRRWYEMTGLSESAGGDGWEEALHPDDREDVAAAARASFANGAPLEIEARIRHADGSYRWHMCRARAVHAADGAVERWYGTCSDIDTRRRLEERLRLGEARLQLALDASNAVGTWDWDLVADMFQVDARFARLLGLPEEVAGTSAPKSAFFDAIDPDDLARARADVALALEKGGPFVATYRIRAEKGGPRWISSRGVCLKDESGAPVRFVGVVIDVTDMKAAEEARALLAHELAHRIKNVFGLLGAIASMSARGRGLDIEAYAADLRGRFRSLSTALTYAQPGISQLVRDRRPVTILALARALLAPFEPGGNARIAVVGADAPVTDDETTGLALLLHELATNAVKYGALARETGHVALDGRIEDGAYVLTWHEKGGPEIRGAPERNGFGLQMIERTIATQLKGSVAFDWRPEGLVATLRFGKSALVVGADEVRRLA